jgi:hypothetical protein
MRGAKSHSQLTTWRVAQQNFGAILASLKAEPRLMFAAFANPLLALQELGYEIPPDVLQEFEDRIRFGASGFEQIRDLRDKIFAKAGMPIDLGSKEAVYELLLRLLGTKQRDKLRSLSLADAAPLPITAFSTKAHDPLESLRGLHPVIEPLLEFRRLEASTPRFAPRELYEEIRQGKRALPITRLVFHSHKRT